MEIRAIVEPEYRDSFWCTEIIKGLSAQVYLKKIRLTEFAEQDIRDLKSGKPGEIIVIIGTTINWTNRITALVHRKGCLYLLATSDQNADTLNRANILLLDYRSSMYTLLSHLSDAGKKRTALFGVNPASYADSAKKEYFPWKDDIYYNYGSIADCTGQFWERIDAYSAVICTNEIAAVYLLRFLLEKGVEIPGRLRLISFGDSFLSRLMSPSIISVEQDFRALGEEIVQVCSFLVRNPMLTVNAFLKCPLWIRDPAMAEGQLLADEPAQPAFPNIDFYEDKDIAAIQNLNRMLVESDSLDIRLLQCLLNREKREKMAENMNLSMTSLRYRIRKLQAYFPEMSENEMLDLIRHYLPSDALADAEMKKREDEGKGRKS